MLDTVTVEIVSMRQSHYIARSLPVAPSEEVPVLWERHLYEWLSHYDHDDRVKIMHFLQLWCGTALAGDCSNEKALFLWGQRGSGKGPSRRP